MPKSLEDLATEFKLTEIRRTYDHEINRRNTLETKASAIFGFATIIIAIFTMMFNFILSTQILPYTLSRILISLSIVSLCFVVVGLFYIRTVLIRKFVSSPYETNPNKILEKLNSPTEIMRTYRRSIYLTKRYNDIKVDSLDKANKFLGIGIGISFLCLISIVVMWW